LNPGEFENHPFEDPDILEDLVSIQGELLLPVPAAGRDVEQSLFYRSFFGKFTLRPAQVDQLDNRDGKEKDGRTVVRRSEGPLCPRSFIVLVGGEQIFRHLDASELEFFRKLGSNAGAPETAENFAVLVDAALFEDEDVLQGDDLSSMPTTSQMEVTFRLPSVSRLTWMIRSRADETMKRIAFSGRLTPVMRIIDSRRVRILGELNGWSRTHDRCSSPAACPRLRRTSPTMIRPGRMRRLLRTRSRCCQSGSLMLGRVSVDHVPCCNWFSRILDGHDSLIAGSKRRGC
jgi:hypothetical protein